MNVIESGQLRTVPASLAVFRVLEDGTLEFVSKYDVETGPHQIWWMGMVSTGMS
jgi:hypothetical protein